MQLTKWIHSKDPDRISLSPQDGRLSGAGVVGISKFGEMILFEDESDGANCIELTKEDAKKAFIEAIAWIDSLD